MYCTALLLSRLYAERAKHDSNDVVHKMYLQAAKMVAILANRLRLGSQYSLRSEWRSDAGARAVHTGRGFDSESTAT
jgi:hypothetical protein